MRGTCLVFVLLCAVACGARDPARARRSNGESHIVDSAGRRIAPVELTPASDTISSGRNVHRDSPGEAKGMKAALLVLQGQVGYAAGYAAALRPNVRWALGLVMLLLNCGLSSAGFLMQRKARLMEEGGAKKQHRFSSRALWALGVAVYMASAAPDVWAYALLPQSLCSAAGCLRVAVVAAAAHFLLGEHLKREEMLGIGSCVLGAALILGFGPSSDETISASPDDFHHPKAWTYLTFGISLLIAVLFLEHADFGRGADVWYRKFSLPFATALAYGLEKVLNTEFGFLQVPETLLRASPSWLGTAFGICALGMLDFYLNLRGVRMLPVQLFVPLTFALGVLVQYFQSAVVLDEFARMSRRSTLLSLFGAVLLLAGALCIRAPRVSERENQRLPGPGWYARRPCTLPRGSAGTAARTAQGDPR